MSSVTVHVHCSCCGSAAWLKIDPETSARLRTDQTWDCPQPKCQSANTVLVRGQICRATLTYREQA